MSNGNGRVTERKTDKDSPPQLGPQDLDPNLPIFHMVPASTMQDVLEVLKKLPWEDVYRVMPALQQARLTQETLPEK